MKTTTKLLSVLLAAVLLTGAYFLGTIRGVPSASAIDVSGLDSKGLAAALSSAVYVSNHTSGATPEYAGEMTAEFYNTFMTNAK